LSFGEYVFIHGTRLISQNYISEINEKKNKSSPLSDSPLDDALKKLHLDDTRSKRDIGQRALGTFHRVVITKDEVYCNCENHKRFRNCNERTLFRLLCHDTSLFTKQEIDTIDTSQGRYSLKNAQGSFRGSLEKRINRNKEFDKAFENKITIFQPPTEDPFLCVIRPDDNNDLKLGITFNGVSHLP